MVTRVLGNVGPWRCLYKAASCWHMRQSHELSLRWSLGVLWHGHQQGRVACGHRCARDAVLMELWSLQGCRQGLVLLSLSQYS